MICKMNEMEVNYEIKELDFSIWNEWEEND